ncbi:beta-lactamase [Cellulophaga sp. RHA19]|uniref:serine hydrolase domain-containing protein n=1 Tax=Cellulophaga sp. RHA19 TaxID=1798237 RepID=UPI000C2B736B|nr:serine hydrolase domain-containing protein [Cellulophaga sp. RHA19]PKB43615.1 beta-lactamase [Cellulophaga sp. RHA19]
MNKKNIFRVLLLVSTVVSFFYVPWPIVTAWLKPVPNTIQEQLNQTINYGFDGVILYVDVAGKPPAFYAEGWHNTEQKITAKPNAFFKIASIDKLYTAVAITKLIGKNKLDLNKSLAYYFPELNGKIEYADKITVKMMVQHRSGIPNYTNTPNFWNNPTQNAEEALELVKGLPASFKPNTDYEYSNTNYLLLSMLIDKTAGKSKFNYIKEVILNPLALKNTYASLKDVPIDNLMSGYYVGINNDIKTTNYGSMIATAEDVGIFLRALNNGNLFTGTENEIYASIYKYNHTGLIPGYQSIAEYHKNIDAVVVQFTNTTDFSGYNWNLSEISYNRIIKIIEKNNSK